MAAAGAVRPVRFGAFAFDPSSRELRKGGTRLRVPDQSLAILAMLLDRPGELVTREEIQARLWPHGTIVEFEHSVNSAVKRLREALSDTAATPRYIETLPRKGYRFIGQLEKDTPEAGALVPGAVVSHYQIVAEAGRGAMGIVYKAEDTKLGRMVALKFLPEELASHPPALARMRREARMIAALNHPNICTMYELGEASGRVFIAMEFLEGETLRSRGKLSESELFDVALQVTRALEAAHGAGMVHRDIKPDNLFLTKHGTVKLMDFGLAKPVEEETGEAQQSSVTGTSGYMSPEQARAKELDARSDLFSFGAVLYEMATGALPFRGGSSTEILKAILDGTPMPAARLNPDVPLELERIIDKALEKDRDLRYQSAAEMRSDLQRLKRDIESRKSVAVSLPVVAAPANRWPWIVTTVVILIAAAVAGYFLLHRRAPKLTDKDTIVLADFTNTTGDPVFDGTLRQGLSVQLEQSPFLSRISDERISRTLLLMKQPRDARLTKELSREVCQRTGSAADIEGSIAHLGGQYVLGLNAANCYTGDLLAQEQGTANGKEQVLHALGDVATKLREKLGESLASVKKFDVPLAEATTSSLEALKAYSLALEKGPVESQSFLRHAIALDPNFAAAYAALGRVYVDLGESGRGAEYLSKAFQLREHTSERERLTIVSNYYANVTGELDKAARAGQEEIEDYPRSRAYARLSVVYFKLGEYEKALEADDVSGDIALSGLRAMFLLPLQRTDEIKIRVQQGHVGNWAGDYILHSALYAVAFLDSDSTGMLQQQGWFAGKREYEHLGLALASDTEAFGGHLRKAQELGLRAEDAAIRADSKENGAIWLENLAIYEAAVGETVMAKKMTLAALELIPSSQTVDSEATLALAIAGEAGRASRLAEELNKRCPLDTQVQLLWLPAIRAQLALNRKNANEALTDLHLTTPPIEFGGMEFENYVSCLYPTYIRGEAYLSAGQGNAAATEFQKILDHSGIVWNCWTGALARLGLGRAYAVSGDTAKAKTAYQDFLTLWKNADPDIPIYRQAKAEYGKLQK